MGTRASASSASRSLSAYSDRLANGSPRPPPGGGGRSAIGDAPSLGVGLGGVKRGMSSCREHMICPLPSAREMSAFRADPGTAVNGKEIIHGHGVGRRGEDDETA